MNEGDVFILDAGLKLYYFPGKDSNNMEKVKGMYVLTSIRNNERLGKADLFYPREDKDCENDFWTLLGGKPDKIKSASEAPPDDDFEDKKANKSIQLFEISNNDGEMKQTEVNYFFKR